MEGLYVFYAVLSFLCFSNAVLGGHRTALKKPRLANGSSKFRGFPLKTRVTKCLFWVLLRRHRDVSANMFGTKQAVD